MNRFRTKKKAKDDTSAGRSSQESEHSSVFSKGFRRGKKNQPEEVKKEIDIATALPSTDDFRTSLLMSNLSARFSMLREQDDPNTKIGKASDDSVLYPKRQSRLADFGFAPPNASGLSDIAEVESIKAPRFRTESYASDDDITQSSTSIMNRSKPTEGNNLFGGRQKIYKIPAGKTGGGGGMVGRALYEDDVAMSSFQRWRKAERERRSLDGDDLNETTQTEDDAEPLGYNRKRETSSTTSSASFARNSTAATSITSQQTGATKDWQSSSTAPTSAASTPALDRNVTRTRRLYEQGNQEGQDQGSALSRIDTFNRQKPFGSRTPDLGGNSPSPTTNGFAERLFAERRAALAKTSAPNLKAVSPPLSAASDAPAEGAVAPGQCETTANFGGSPPLSPPLSEEEDQTQRVLPIQPNDLGKATAMGVFQKPSQPYDESKYAQRQIQLQQGRETPTGRFRAESNASSFVTGRSRSSEPVKTQPAVEEETVTLPQLSLEPRTLNITAHAAPQLGIERPSDKDHPAFRQSPAPAPPISTSGSADVSPISEKLGIKLDVPSADSAQASPDHSPTLGSNPNTGLSGMVRQHLRSESNASSIYGPTPPTSGFEPQFPIDHESTPDLPAPKSNPWLSPGQEWTASFYGNISEPSLKTDKLGVSTEPKLDPAPEKGSSRSSHITEEETDEFASQLADARRRVREKLTSYVESDSSRAASPLSHSDSSKDLAASNPLGIAVVKPKTSRGSLIDRSRSLVSGQTKTKLLGIGASTMSTSPSPSKQTFEDREAAPLETMAEESPREMARNVPPVLPEIQRGPENKAEKEPEEETNAHPGLRAFRQARRELQRNKELEMLARHQMTNQSQPLADSAASTPPRPSNEYGARQRTPSRERRPPPISYRQRERAPSEDGYHQASNTNSPTAPKMSGERERSGSDTSGRSSSRPRPPRLRGNLGHHEDQYGPANPPRQQQLHAPGLPGTDIRRSPIMPPQGGIRGALSPASSPHMLHSSKSASNLAVHNRPAYEPNYGMPSPISPSGLPPPSPYALGPGASPIGTPTFGPRSRQNSATQSPAFGPVNGGPGGHPRRVVDKRDISEPTFVMSTSRVPTVNLPQQMDGSDYGHRQYGGQRYAGDGNPNAGSAPPVPPINPRRKRETSRPRPYDESGLGAPRLPFASQGNGSTSSLDYTEDDRSVYDGEEEDNHRAANQRQRLAPTRKAQFEGGALPRGPGRRDNSPPFVAKGPPASRTVMTSNVKVNPNMNVPGGMF
ncbi:hypothetical protein B0T14DRAFT_435841 [Immersiella caudata]|uniref:Uncharacterized protein n=1 Tax=Immersiella caudata TaxID=314043 RepID=A0AA40BWZ9_9PEZI|nr:hypothetical protein B0T14DRAFT_435841 [Immersiella caudata]